MKSKIKIILLCLLTQMAFSQTRKEWRGKVVRDSSSVENVIVYNINTKKGTVTDMDGMFKLQAVAGDTLSFSGLAINSRRIILSKRDSESAYITVKLQSFVNELETVDINNKKLMRTLSTKGSQTLVDKKYFDDSQSSPKNPYIYTGAITDGTDFVRLYKDIVKLVRKKRAKDSSGTTPFNFSETAVDQFDFDFYTRDLKLDDNEIKLFLVFCENDPKVATFTSETTKFELMDFMINKNVEFKRLINTGK